MYLFYCKRIEKDHLEDKELEINSINKNIYAWNQYYYYYDIQIIRVGRS